MKEEKRKGKIKRRKKTQRQNNWKREENEKKVKREGRGEMDNVKVEEKKRKKESK